MSASKTSDGEPHQVRGQLWHGRFASGPAAELMAFTESLSYDQRLIFSDIACSKAHVTVLASAGLLDDSELGAILDGLDSVEAEYRTGKFEFMGSDEDIHTAIERRVTELVGPAGGKLHTGRSRNDQVSTAFRHCLKGELDAVAERLVDMIETLLVRADEAVRMQMLSICPATPIYSTHNRCCWLTT